MSTEVANIEDIGVDVDEIRPAGFMKFDSSFPQGYLPVLDLLFQGFENVLDFIIIHHIFYSLVTLLLVPTVFRSRGKHPWPPVTRRYTARRQDFPDR